MKKCFRILSLVLMMCLMLNTLAFAQNSENDSAENKGFVTLYAPDGRSERAPVADVEAWKTVGWYEYPVAAMYSPNGSVAVAPASDVEAWKAVGWYDNAYSKVYSPSGEEKEIYTTEMSAWKAMGWFDVPVTRVWAPDGRMEIIATSAVQEWEKVGWYKAIAGNDTYVNEKELASETDFLIWVSKNEYKVRLYVGSKGNWNLIKEMTCAIGAPSTPTCEGTYKYFQAQKMWDYGTYYVGPIMRFNRGYAIHSTLLYKNGTPMDNRVGMKLSHGCVRLQPQDINWLASVVPLQTTIHVTP